MARFDDAFLLSLLQACAEREPEPLYPARFSQEQQIDRDRLDQALDELRRRGLIKLTDWVKDSGQGRALTDAGKTALAGGSVAAAAPAATDIAPALDPARNAYDRGELVRDALIHPGTAYVARVFLVINIAVFFGAAVYAGAHDWSVGDYLIGEGSATTKTLIDLGGLHPVLVFHSDRPQFERLLLYSVLHIGLLHLVLNMFFLLTLAPSIEAMWGRWRFLTIYLVSAFVGGCVVVMVSLLQRDNTLTAGASGSMYGIFVAMIVWFSLNHEHVPEHFLQGMSRMLVPNIILMVAINFSGSVSWQGHFGGALGGLLTALLLHVQRFHPWLAMRLLALVAVPLVPLGFFVAMLWQAGWLTLM